MNRSFLIRTLVNAAALYVAAALVPGIAISGPVALIFAALVFGVVNAVVRPVLFVLSLPVTVLTLGLFLLVINAAMLGLTALLLPGMQVAGFGSAVLGAIVVSVVAWLAARFIGRDEERG